MKYTTNYNLYKPDYDDTIDVNFLNQNMDVLDGTVAGLNYVQNVNTSNKGLTFIKRDGQQIDVPLNYLKLTGGTVKGDTEFTGKLTNNGKIVGQLFNGSAEIKPILDWDKMKEVYGSTMSSTTTIYKGKSKTITYPDWCVYAEDLGLKYFNPASKNAYLLDDFTNYDEVIFHMLTSTLNTTLYNWKSKVLEYMFENQGYVNVADAGAPYIVYHGFYQYGAKTATDVSTKRVLKFQNSSGWLVDIFGIKYTEVK